MWPFLGIFMVGGSHAVQARLEAEEAESRALRLRAMQGYDALQDKELWAPGLHRDPGQDDVRVLREDGKAGGRSVRLGWFQGLTRGARRLRQKEDGGAR